MAASLILTDEFIAHFKITEFSKPKKGGQKTVFYVKIKGKIYALKILNVVDERFLRELKICQRFQGNGGIPKIISVESYNKETVIIEEYIEGDDLSDIHDLYLKQERKVCELILKICDILIPIWEARYVHRDLKPENVRIKKNGDPVILDFGIARALDETSLTLTGNQPLSYLFGSPEQYAGNKSLISYRTDFFSLGVIAYYLYMNKLPFGSNKIDINDVFSKKATNVTMSSMVLQDFCNAVFKINPSERPRNPDQLIKYLTI